MKRKILFSVSLKLLISVVVFKFIPSFEDETLGAVFSVLAQLVVFEHTEGLVDAAFSADVFGVEDVAEIFCVEAIEVGEDGIKLGLKDGSALRIVNPRLMCPNCGSSERCSSLISSHNSSTQPSMS